MPDMTPNFGEPVLSPADTAADPPAGIRGLLSNPAARIVVIAAAVVGLLVIAGIVVGVVLMNLGKKALDQTTANTINTALNSAPAPAATRTVEATAQGNRLSIPVTNKDVFVSRDPFEPVVKPLPPAPVSAETSIPPGEHNVLTLQDIVSYNGVLKALMKWDGTQYSAAAGEVLGKSPWKVLSITKTTVTMLYGDVQVTLSVGEGLQKN